MAVAELLHRKPSAKHVLQVPSKLLEIFSKSWRTLQDSWNKSQFLEDSKRMSEDALLFEKKEKITFIPIFYIIDD